MVAVHYVVSFTEREYLALEAVAEIKHEYFDGQIVGMAGAEPEHNQIVQNLRAVLTIALATRPCRITGADQRVKCESRAEYFYPDVVVTCTEPRYSEPGPRSLVNPQLIGEVLSPSTAAHDRGPKWLAYQTIASLDDYLIIASDRRRVDHHQRSGDAWTLRTLGAGGALTTTGGVRIEVDELYRLVSVA